MYPWDKTAAAHCADHRADHGAKDRRPRRPRRAAAQAGSATHAVQVALDRRDNGGDAEGTSATSKVLA
jgi:hypothetical protein